MKARNSLEKSYHGVKNSTTERSIKNHLGRWDVKKVKRVEVKALKWIEHNENCEKEEYEKKLKEVESVVNPVTTKV